MSLTPPTAIGEPVPRFIADGRGEEQQLSVTRIELVRHIEAAFGRGPVTRDDLVSCAQATQARAELVAVIQTLPDKTYLVIRDLWYELAHVPVGT